VSQINKSILSYLKIGIIPEADAESRRRVYLLNGMNFVGVTIVLLFSIQSFLSGNERYGLLLTSFGMLATSNTILFYYHKRYLFAATILSTLISALLLYLLLTGGVDNSGVLWYYAYPPIILSLFGSRKASFITVLFFSISFYIIETENFPFKTSSYSSAFMSRFISTNIVLYLLMLFYEIERHKSVNSLKELTIKYRELAQRDTLTQLLNRRGIEPLIESQFNIAKRGGHNFSIIIADLDHFKRINDSCGHAVGDTVLVEVADIINTALREQDFVSRWGGEEFLILLPETDCNGAKKVCENLREKVQEHQYNSDNENLGITISLGAACFSDNTTVEEIIRKADLKLYEAKESGRNCFVVG